MSTRKLPIRQSATEMPQSVQKETEFDRQSSKVLAKVLESLAPYVSIIFFPVQQSLTPTFKTGSTRRRVRITESKSWLIWREWFVSL